MNDAALFEIGQHSLNGEIVQTTNARELHKFLESKRHFADWIKTRIREYGFKENIDFLCVSQKNETQTESGKSNVSISKEYFVSLDMAKELAMVEKNILGQTARRYFIRCEKDLKQNQPPSASQSDIMMNALNNPEALRQLLLSYSEKVIALEKNLNENAPKVAFFEDVTQKADYLKVSEAAKILDTGMVRLFSNMRRWKMLTEKNIPMHRFIENGYLALKETRFTDAKGIERIRPELFITGAGLIYIRSKLKAEKSI